MIKSMQLSKAILLLTVVWVVNSCSLTEPSATSSVINTPVSAYGINEYTLKNGIKLIVGEDHRAPVVVSQVWYRVGSADEYSGITGISHTLEHMMFKGTKKYSRQQFTEIIQRYGGRDNAFTGTDYTAYYQVFEKSHLPISFDVESDRMINLILREQDFEKEINVVKEERRWRVDDNPESQLREHLYSIALDQSPYQNPIIGWQNDLDNMMLQDLQQWYTRWYAPNNATIVVVGDINTDEVLALAQQYFAHIPVHQLPHRKPRHETAQQGERRTHLEANVTHPQIAIAYKAPRVGNTKEAWHPYALMVLAELLSGTESSRFERNLVRGKEIAQSIGVGYSAYQRYDGLFYIKATPVVGNDIIELEKNIHLEIAKIYDGNISEDELKPIKIGLIAHEVYRRDSIRHQAYLLGSFETIGVGWQELFKLREKIEAVTPQQIGEVARLYLHKDNRTVATLKPNRSEN